MVLFIVDQKLKCCIYLFLKILLLPMQILKRHQQLIYLKMKTCLHPSTGLFLLENKLFFPENKLPCICPVYDIGFKVLSMRISYHVSGQTKDYQIGICCFSAMHAALRRKIKDCLAPNQDNVS